MSFSDSETREPPRRNSDRLKQQVASNTKNINTLGEAIDEIRADEDLNRTQTERIGEFVLNLNQELKEEVNDRLNQGETLRAKIDGVDEGLQKLQGETALNKDIGTVAALMGELEKYKEMASKPETRDKIPLSQAQLDTLLNDLISTSLVQIEKGPEKHDPNWYQSLFKRDTTKQIWEKILDLKIVPTTDYSVKKVQYERSSNTASMVELIKLGNYLVTKTGRENGPDLALTIESIPSIDFNSTASDDLKNLINDKTSITEVLNILAFLTHSKDTKRSVDKRLSVDGALHNQNGEYLSKPLQIVNGENSADLESWALCLDGLKGAPIFSTETMDVHTNFSDSMSIYIPPGILKRKLDNSARGRIEIKKDDVKPLFTACTAQMIKILNDVRRVFTGWAGLSRTTTGGSAKSKTKTKKTRRRYRRKY